MPDHIVRGHFKAIAAGQANVLVVGDSIANVYQSWSLMGSYVKKSPFGTRGGRTGTMNSGGSGFPLQASMSAMEGSVTAKRPGEDVGDGTSGQLALQTNIGEGNSAGNFGSPIQVNINPAVGPESVWDENSNVDAILVAESRPANTNYAQWRLQVWDRANTNITPDVTTDLTQAKAIRVWTKNFNTGTGATNTRARHSAWSGDETGYLKVSSVGVRANKAQGIFWGYIGHGSWTLANHASASGFLITADAPSYTGAYSDELLQVEYSAYSWNYIVVILGANQASDEWNGTNLGNWPTRLATLRARHIAAAAAAGKPAPKFCFISQYDLADTTTQYDQMRAALKQFALDNPDVEFIDFCKWQRDTYGAHSAWKNAQLNSAEGDFVHPSKVNGILRDNQATLFYSQLTAAPNTGPLAGIVRSGSRSNRDTRELPR